jgi:protoporphyrinogen oxidase
MRVAVVGAGIAGLVSGLRLTEAGHDAVVFERWPGLGGQAATVDVGEGVRIERYYHHWFTSDRAIVDLCAELGVEVEWLKSSMGFLAHGALHPFTTPLDLLRFRPVPLWARLRMGLAVVLLQRRGLDVAPYETETAASWVRRAMGRPAWDEVWGPLLRGKFGERAEDISMAWLWSKLTLRRQVKGSEARKELLGYPVPSFEALNEALAARAGEVRIDAPAARIARDGEGFAVTAGAADSFRRGHDPREFEPAGEPEHFDAVIATVPGDVFTRLLEPGLAAEVGEDYLGRVASMEYREALCLVLEVDRQVLPFYWTNVADRDVPFIGLIEHTNFVDPARYGGRRFLYVANYLPHDDPLLDLDPDALLEAYLPGLRRASPAFSPDWVLRRWRFREPAGQPVVDLGYHERIPPLRTPAPGLVLANTTQIYPEDRGTNYSVVLGDRAVAALLG